MWESAALSRAKKLPELGKFLDPPRTRRLTPDQAQQARDEFETAKAASDRVPVRPRSVAGRENDPD